MLYINGELLETQSKKTDYAYKEIVDDYFHTLKAAKENYGQYLILQTRVRPRKDDAGAMRFPGPRGLLLQSVVSREQGDGSSVTQELRYSPVILKKVDGELWQENPGLLIHKGTFSIDIERNADLAYYVLKCGKVGLSEEDGKKFNIYDPKAVNQTQANKHRIHGQVLNLIYTEISEANLRVLAKSWGISDVNIKDLDTVREELFEKVEAGEQSRKKIPGSKARGYNDFIDSAQVTGRDKVAALVRDAEERKSLVYDDMERRWVLDYQDGGTPYVLKQLAGLEYGNPIESLVSFLATEPDHLRKLEDIMGVGAPPSKPKPVLPPMPKKLTAEMVEATKKVPSLKKLIRDNIPGAKTPNTMTGDEAREVLLAHIQETAEA